MNKKASRIINTGIVVLGGAACIGLVAMLNTWYKVSEVGTCDVGDITIHAAGHTKYFGDRHFITLEMYRGDTLVGTIVPNSDSAIPERTKIACDNGYTLEIKVRTGYDHQDRVEVSFTKNNSIRQEKELP